ncbi:MAG TPA: anthranilate synthase component I family protein [Verrucomicrobiae bacterium]|nr:anthranilate synthase component I family protein [Verrucomicrobiae bacterium]
MEQFEEFAARPGCVWLDTASGEGVSLLAAEPAKVFRAKGERGVFDRLRAELEGWRGYAIGYFGYDLKNEIERLPAHAVDDLGLPDCWFGFYDDVQVFHRTVTPQYSSAPALQHSNPTLRSNFTRESYRAMVLRAKEYIAAGDVYQVNLSQRFQCEVTAPAPEVYRALRAWNPAPYGAYLDIGDAQILSTSPECFLNIRDRHVVTRPIKGTRARQAVVERASRPFDAAWNTGETPVPLDRTGGTPVLPDDLAIRELLRSPKDNAELLMITDLERNDLGKVCEFGSVFVSELRRVETFATVHHLVATVEGRLRRDVSHVDCLRTCFPGGSITGAPKIRAMEIIDELEPHARGVYCGAIGYFGPNGRSQFNIAIRTVVYVGRASRLSSDMHQRGGTPVLPAGGRLTFHAGGGIVADSEPEAEYDETLAKARGILHAIDQLRVC